MNTDKQIKILLRVMEMAWLELRAYLQASEGNCNYIFSLKMSLSPLTFCCFLMPFRAK